MNGLPIRALELLLAALCLGILFFLVAPILIIIPMSFTAKDYLEFPPSAWSLRWYIAYFSDPDWTGPTLFSLKIATLSAIASTVSGTMAALALVRARLLGNAFVNGMIAAPMVVPAVITAVAFYMLLSRLHMLGSTAGFTLADTVLTLPFVIFPVAANLQRVEPRLEWTALSLGASRFASIRLVTLPLARPGMMIGAAFAFITAFDEATVSAFISSFDGKTLPKKMFEGIDWELSPIIAAVASMLTLISVLVVLLLAVLRWTAQPRIPPPARNRPSPERAMMTPWPRHATIGRRSIMQAGLAGAASLALPGVGRAGLQGTRAGRQRWRSRQHLQEGFLRPLHPVDRHSHPLRAVIGCRNARQGESDERGRRRRVGHCRRQSRPDRRLPAILRAARLCRAAQRGQVRHRRRLRFLQRPETARRSRARL